MIVFFFLYSLLWSVGTLPQAKYQINKQMKGLGYFLRLDTYWGMFAPTVFKDDGWYVLEATKKDSSRIDINRNGQAVDYQKPTNIVPY